MTVTPEEPVDERSFRLRMTLNNHMPGFAACAYESLNGTAVLIYDVTGMQPLSVWLEERRADRSFLKKFTAAFLSGLDTLGVYFLEPECLLLTSNTVFVDRKTGEFCFVCFPCDRESLDVRLAGFAGYLLSRSSEDAADIRAAYRFYAACSRSDITAEALIEVMRSLEDEEGATPPSQQEDERGEPEGILFEPEPPAHRTGVRRMREKEKKEKEKKEKEKKEKGPSFLRKLSGIFGKKHGKNDGSGEEENAAEAFASENDFEEAPKWQEIREPAAFAVPDPGYCGETVVLSRYREPQENTSAWLVPEDVFTGESLELKKDEYVIGRALSPGVINIGVKAVSRKHARFTRIGNTYEITDLGSRNGTRVNGEELSAGRRVLLSDGDKVCFADVEYIYRLTDNHKVNYTINAV